MPQTGFVVLVPEAEPLVGAFRAEHDESARLGVPAHITVLFPFMDPASITEKIVLACTRVLSSHQAFSFLLS